MKGQNRPNIIFFLSDQHNTVDLADTPNINALKAEGMSFTRTYCSSPLCVPSRAGLLTGKLPAGTGVWDNVQCLSSDERTMAHSLSENGYQTILCGRMHFNYQDQTHGFDEHLVGEITPTFPRPQRQASVYGPLKGSPDQSYTSIRLSGAGQSAVHLYDSEVADTACDVIRHAKDKGKPLFLLVGFYGPHCPFVAKKELYDKYFERFKDIKAFRDMESLHPEIRRFIALRGIENVTDDELRRVTAAYYANVEFIDNLIGQVLETAKSELDMENTVVIYSSDHGDSLGSHGLFWKSNFYKESVNVPLVFSWKNHINHDIVDAPVSLLDLAPTITELTGSESLENIYGKSLCPVLNGSKADKTRDIFSLLSDLKGDNPSGMIVRYPFKLIKFAGCDLPILFNIEDDPEENRNLASEPGYSGITADLLDALDKVWNEDDALSLLERQKKEASERKRWVLEAKPEIVGEWQAPPESNYIIQD